VPSFALSGKTALVTGAAKGIGFETARLLHARGASVALTDLDAAEVEGAAAAIGQRTLALAGDATDREALDDAVAATVERFGGLDVVVANAGIGPPLRPVAAADPVAFERVVEVNLLGVYRTVRAALPQIIERRGQVVLIASLYSFANGTLVAPYAVSKAGVEALGRGLGVELAAKGAGVTIVYPGFIDTKMVRDGFADPIGDGLEGVLPPFLIRRIAPARAAERIVAAIERRAPRVVVPRWYAPFAVLRGILGPLMDRAMARDRRVLELVDRAEGLASEAQGAESSRPRSSA
jgi:NAD(P)-dependent dehydrogenase (short-subunit alcohol dehydrogenase family)